MEDEKKEKNIEQEIPFEEFMQVLTMLVIKDSENVLEDENCSWFGNYSILTTFTSLCRLYLPKIEDFYNNSEENKETKEEIKDYLFDHSKYDA